MRRKFIMKILGTGSYLPKCIITNDALSEMVETNDEWITSRTGIKTRHISDGETVSDMATEAAKCALLDADMDAEAIDMILLATMTGDEAMPTAACKVQKAIGAKNATCMDLSAACTGFVFALNTANAYLVCGMYKNILVIGADTVSKVVDWTDRGTCVLFGDGAGAVIVTADDTKRYLSVTGSDGEKGEVLSAGKIALQNFLVPGEKTVSKEDYYMSMNGQEVFKFAVKKVPEAISKLVEKAQISFADIDYYLLHQANIRIIASVAKRLEIDEEKIPVNLQNYGNTSAASVAILLDEIRKQGKITEGTKIIIAGFGGGLTWGAAYIEI